MKPQQLKWNFQGEISRTPNKDWIVYVGPPLVLFEEHFERRGHFYFDTFAWNYTAHTTSTSWFSAIRDMRRRMYREMGK